MTTRVVHVNDNVPGAIYIGRAVPRKGLKRSAWANPHKIDKFLDRSASVALYRRDLEDDLTGSNRQAVLDALYELRGKPLACWCRHDGEMKTAANTCHGDVIIEALRDVGWEDAP